MPFKKREKRKVLQEKVTNVTTAEQVYNPEKYQIMNTRSPLSKSFMWCAQSVDRKMRKIAQSIVIVQWCKAHTHTHTYIYIYICVCVCVMAVW